MDTNQITNIAIKIGELGTKTSYTFWIAIIGALAAIFSAIVAGIFAGKLNRANKQHEKQWAYIGKVSAILDNGIEIFARMLFNKLLVVYNLDVNAANQNLFLLQKDILVVESQLIVYGSLEIADAVYKFKNLIVQTPDKDFLKKWEEIYKKGNELLMLCRRDFGVKLSEKFEEFTVKLTETAPVFPSGIKAELMGSTSLEYKISRLPTKQQEK